MVEQNLDKVEVESSILSSGTNNLKGKDGIPNTTYFAQ